MKVKTHKSIVASAVAVAALAGVSTAQAMTPQSTGPRASLMTPQYVGPRASVASPQYVGPRFRIVACINSKGALRVFRVSRTKATFKPNPNGCR